LESADPLDAIETYVQQGWTDGLPVIPPTPERVQAFLDHMGLAGDELLGGIPTREVTVSAEKVAINAVMAGCLPEYMPVVVAAVKAILHERFNLHGNSATLSGASQTLILNGPVRAALGINCRAGLFGPGFRANATIGRAVRLVVWNVCRSTPALFDRAAFAHPGRFTWCFGENEEESPWQPLHVQLGFRPEDSVVTAYALMDTLTMLDNYRTDPDDLLDRLAYQIRCTWTYQGTSDFDRDRTLVLVFAPPHAAFFSQNGWQKADIQERLFARLTAPAERFAVRCAIYDPRNLYILYAGGGAMNQTYVFIPFPSHQPISLPIENLGGAS
jgi:hypothetical protein